ncbi:MAG TPA: hypothetical protein VGI31_12260 [Streptosporangiaceae bacterium]|jgi:hypothetical protein
MTSIDDRYPQRLDALHRRCAGGGLVASPSGHVLGSPGAVSWAPGPPSLARLGLACASVPAGADGSQVAAPGSAAAAAFADGLVELHADVLRQGLDHAMTHLEARSAQGTTLLAKQKVQCTIADIAMELRECEALRRDAGAPDGEGTRRRWQATQRLTVAGRSLLRLLGAAGFLADGTGGEVHMAEIAGNVYLHPGTHSGAERHDDHDENR